MVDRIKTHDDRDSVIEALRRIGGIDLFNVLIADGNRHDAVKLLVRVGIDEKRASRIVSLAMGRVDQESAWRMVEVLIADDGDEPPAAEQ
jgi:hypothetical protein